MELTSEDVARKYDDLERKVDDSGGLVFMTAGGLRDMHGYERLSDGRWEEIQTALRKRRLEHLPTEVSTVGQDAPLFIYRTHTLGTVIPMRIPTAVASIIEAVTGAPSEKGAAVLQRAARQTPDVG